MNTNTWRSMVSNNRLVAALVAGFVATHMATVTGYWYPMIGFVNGQGFVALDWPAFNGLLIRPQGTAWEQWIAGAVFHTFTGFCYSLIFAFLIHPLLPWKNTTLGNIGKGLVWALFLALLSALWWVPTLFPQFNPGFLSLNLGWKTTVGIFIWHAVYGVHLGALYNPLPGDEPTAK